MVYNFFYKKFLEDNLFSLKIKQFLFGPIRSILVQFGPLGPTQSNLVYSVNFDPLRSILN